MEVLLTRHLFLHKENGACPHGSATYLMSHDVKCVKQACRFFCCIVYRSYIRVYSPHSYMFQGFTVMNIYIAPFWLIKSYSLVGGSAAVIFRLEVRQTGSGQVV
jgi:hypothetical protein